jgi:hypothetical protein
MPAGYTGNITGAVRSAGDEFFKALLERRKLADETEKAAGEARGAQATADLLHKNGIWDDKQYLEFNHATLKQKAAMVGSLVNNYHLSLLQNEENRRAQEAAYRPSSSDLEMANRLNMQYLPLGPGHYTLQQFPSVTQPPTEGQQTEAGYTGGRIIWDGEKYSYHAYPAPDPSKGPGPTTMKVPDPYHPGKFIESEAFATIPGSSQMQLIHIGAGADETVIHFTPQGVPYTVGKDGTRHLVDPARIPLYESQGVQFPDRPTTPTPTPEPGTGEKIKRFLFGDTPTPSPTVTPDPRVPPNSAVAEPSPTPDITATPAPTSTPAPAIQPSAQLDYKNPTHVDYAVGLIQKYQDAGESDPIGAAKAEATYYGLNWPGQ